MVPAATAPVRPIIATARSRGNVRRLVATGVLTEVIYLVMAVGPFSLLNNGSQLTDLGGMTGHTLLAALLVTGGLIALFILYALTIRELILQPNLGIAPVLVGTVVFCVTLVLM